MNLSSRILFLLVFSLCSAGVFASGDEPSDAKKYDATETIMHHIADGNEFEIIHGVSIPLPIILYAPGHGWTFGMSSMFHHGQTAVDGYVLSPRSCAPCSGRIFSRRPRRAFQRPRNRHLRHVGGR